MNQFEECDYAMVWARGKDLFIFILWGEERGKNAALNFLKMEKLNKCLKISCPRIGGVSPMAFKNMEVHYFKLPPPPPIRMYWKEGSK